MREVVGSIPDHVMSYSSCPNSKSVMHKLVNWPDMLILLWDFVVIDVWLRTCLKTTEWLTKMFKISMVIYTEYPLLMLPIFWPTLCWPNDVAKKNALNTFLLQSSFIHLFYLSPIFLFLGERWTDWSISWIDSHSIPLGTTYDQYSAKFIFNCQVN